MIISTLILRRSYDTVVLLFLPDMMAFYEPIFITQYLQVVLLLCYLFTWNHREEAKLNSKIGTNIPIIPI